MILALDPGLTTGWAVIDEKGKVVGTGNLRPEDVEESLDYIIRLFNRNRTKATVVVEDFPPQGTGDLAGRLNEVLRSIDKVLEVYEIKAQRVTPGVWKTSAQGIAPVLLKEWEGMPLTAHQKDAIRMAKYVLARSKK